MQPIPDDVETALIRELKAIAPRLCSGGRSEWTDAFTTSIAALGRQLGYYVRGAHLKKEDGSGHEPPRVQGEWLYDIAWLRYVQRGADWELTEVPLVAESEWLHHQDAIDYDFEKLLVGRASHRLMVIRTRPSRDDAEYRIRLLEERIPSFLGVSSADRYLFACICPPAGRVAMKLYVHGVRSLSIAPEHA
jgi:hypothetical protein